jgi:hypothetical protein
MTMRGTTSSWWHGIASSSQIGTGQGHGWIELMPLSRSCALATDTTYLRQDEGQTPGTETHVEILRVV